MPKPKKTDLFEAVQSFRIAGDKKNPRGRFITKGHKVFGDDQLIKSHAKFFTLATDLVVETATAAPGETRNVTIPEPEDDGE